MSNLELKKPELLLVEDDRGRQGVGGDQLWYPKKGYIPSGACGAAVAACVLAYLLRSGPEYYAAFKSRVETPGLAEPLSDAVNTKAGFLEFMKLIYPFFLPRAGGLMSDDFCEGIGAFGTEYGLPLEGERLLIPVTRSKRHSTDEVIGFIQGSLKGDMPVAFLTLSAGKAEGLENWHWVSILAFDAKANKARIANNCVVSWTDIKVWLDTSIMGGAFARLKT